MQVLHGSTPLSHRYGGHQFGYWSGQLGDGRAHMLGEYVSQAGDRWELQLKVSHHGHVMIKNPFFFSLNSLIMALYAIFRVEVYKRVLIEDQNESKGP